MVAGLKWGLGKYVEDMHKYISESSKRYSPTRCFDSKFEKRVFDPREILGAWFFREFSLIDLADPPSKEYTIDDIFEQDVRSHETDLQIKIGKSAKNDRDWLRAKINRGNLLEIGRRCNRIIDDAYSIPESSKSSILVSDMYEMRSKNERKFLYYLGGILNSLPNQNPRSYIEQMEIIHKLIQKRS